MLCHLVMICTGCVHLGTRDLQQSTRILRHLTTMLTRKSNRMKACSQGEEELNLKHTWIYRTVKGHFVFFLPVDKVLLED